MLDALIDWLNNKPLAPKHIMGFRIVEPTGMQFYVELVAELPVVTVDQLKTQLIDIPEFNGHELDESHGDGGMMIQLQRARSKIAHLTRRGTGNTIIETPTGVIITYVGQNPDLADCAIVRVGDGQYTTAPHAHGIKNYFAIVTGNPDALLAAWAKLVPQHA